MGRKRQEDNEKEKDRAGGKGRVKSGWNRLENNNEREKGNILHICIIFMCEIAKDKI